RGLQLLVRFLGELVALALLLADRKQADARVVEPEDIAGVDVAHDGELQKVPRLRIHVGARVEEDRELPEVRENGGDRRPVHTRPPTTTAGPWSPPMASTATFRLGPFDGDDLPTLVVAAVRADSVRQLDLAALRTERARRRGELVVRAALAPARLRVASFRQRHGGVSLARASRRQVSEYGQPRVRRAIPASAGHHVPVPAADGAQAQTVLTAARLHRERERRPRFEQAG